MMITLVKSSMNRIFAETKSNEGVDGALKKQLRTDCRKTGLQNARLKRLKSSCRRHSC